MSCIKPYQNVANIVEGCPNSDDILLFTDTNGLSVFRTWGQIRQCLGGSPPIKGAVGGEDLPQDQESTYQDNRLIGIDSDGNGVQLNLAEQIYSSYGNNKSFDFDNDAGLITWINGNVFNEGDSFYMSTNQ